MKIGWPVDRENLLVKKNITIFLELHHLFSKPSLWGKMPPGGNEQLL